MRRTTFQKILAPLALVLLLAGCSPSSDEDARVAAAQAAAKPKTALDTEATRLATTAAAPGALGPAVLQGDAPAEKQLPKDVKDALKGEIEPWLFAWRIGLGTFRVDELARTDTQTLVEDGLEPFDGNAEGQDLRLLYLAIPSPKGGVLLDPYLDWTLAGEAGRVRAEHDGFASVDLIDLNTRIRQHVLDGRGPGARIDGAFWLDDARFVVFAGERNEPNPWQGGPVLYVVDLEKATIERYAGPSGDHAAFTLVTHDLDRLFRKRLPEVSFTASR